jgi:hypothetical protein
MLTLTSFLLGKDRFDWQDTTTLRSRAVNREL